VPRKKGTDGKEQELLKREFGPLFLSFKGNTFLKIRKRR
jgi:hypothetical protein